ncbi:MAG: hypothetical protein R2932_17760 [Caldilineaceae bacterium]
MIHFVLGFLLYAVLMGLVGAIGNIAAGISTDGRYLYLCRSYPLMLGSIFISNPDASIARFLSWFPITAPTAMLLRLPLAAKLPWLDIAISLSGFSSIMIGLAIWV